MNNPLAHRLFGQDLVDQQDRAFGHAPRPTAGTEPTAFAAESHQMLGVAVVALHAQKAVFQTAALNPHFSPGGVRY
jgi:hypothetical protein